MIFHLIMSYYNNISSGYDELYKEEQLNKIKLILQNVKINSEDKILDVGCGTGVSWDLIPTQNIVGIDPSNELIEKSKHKKNMILGKAEKMPLRDNEFDVVISLTAIHNFEDIKKGLIEIKRVGKDKFALSILKKSKKLDFIKKEINKLFKVKKEINEGKDIIFII